MVSKLKESVNQICLQTIYVFLQTQKTIWSSIHNNFLWICSKEYKLAYWWHYRWHIDWELDTRVGTSYFSMNSSGSSRVFWDFGKLDPSLLNQIFWSLLQPYLITLTKLPHWVMSVKVLHMKSYDITLKNLSYIQITLDWIFIKIEMIQRPQRGQSPLSTNRYS